MSTFAYNPARRPLSSRHARFALLPLLLLAASLLPDTVHAERPAAPRLLPRDTLVYFRIDDTRQLVSAFRETSAGRIAEDDKVRPLLAHLYGSIVQAFAENRGELGMSLEDLLSIPQGELCFAVVAPEVGAPALAVIVDAGDNLPAAEQLIEFGRQRAIAEGASFSTEDAAGTEINILRRGNSARAAYFIREQTIVIVTDVELARQLLAVWDGESVPTLADNRRFTTIMSRSQGTKDERPQISWFVEPIELARRMLRGNVSASVGLALLPALGLDGLQAIGGSVILATEEFDSIMHLHVMMQSPREGVLKMIAIQPGDITPENWVPRDAAGYITIHWDARQTYDALQPLYDAFRGPGALESDLRQRISDPAGIDFQEDLLDAFDGRISVVTWMEKPARLNSQATLVALRMKDAEAFSKTLDTIMQRVAPDAEKRSVSGVSYYRLSPLFGRRGQQTDAPEDSLLRRPEPALAIVGDYVMVTDSVKLLEEVIATPASGMSLAGELDFKLIASKFKQHARGQRPGMISFNRPEEGMRLMYELATSDATRARLEGQAEQNAFFRAIHQALQDNQLPPFADIARYLAPSGGLLVSDETGLHYTTFGLKRE